MRRLFERFQKDLEGFIEQRGQGVLVLAMAGEQIAYAVKILKQIEDAGSPDVFLLFPHDFDGPAQFASLVVGRIEASYRAVLEELGPQRETMPIPPFPVHYRDEKLPAAGRLRQVLMFARFLVPPAGGGRLVFGLLPLQIKDLPGYRGLVEQLVQTPKGMPWFRGMRIIVREDSRSPMLSPTVKEEPFVKFLSTDLSTEAMVASLNEELADPETLVEQRAQALVQLAGHDYANRRYEEALVKYNELQAYYQETGDLTMLTFVLIGVGDVHSRMQKPALAKEWFERALVPAAECGSPILLFTLGRNLGHIYYEQKQFAQAETFFDGAQQLGLLTRDPDCKILALEWRGLSQEQQLSWDRAADSFEEAARLALEFKRDEHRQRNLGHLRKTLKQLRQQDRLARVERELAGS